MNSPIPGTLFDGETLRTVPVELVVDGGRLASTDAARTVDVALADVRTSDRLAQVPRFLYLPGNRTIETADNASVDALLARQSRGGLVRIVHALESHARIAAGATVLLVLLTAASLWWGLPVLARRAAMAVPESIEYQAGRAGLASFNQMLRPTGLGRRDRERVQRQLDRLVQAAAIDGKTQLEFRSMGGTFPNAFALPGGIIVISDELVELATEDDELAAVLAHEIGHWRQRHGLQTVLRDSAALLVVSSVTGDLSTLTTFAGTIPFTLLQRGYSREFETEADLLAVQLLLRAQADPRRFASVLKKLEDSRPTAGNDLTYLGTHPGTKQRIDRVYDEAQRLGWKNPGPLPPAAPPAPVEKAAVHPQRTKLVVEKNPDELPVSVSRNPPYYPADLRAQGLTGTVRLEFIIDTKGDVRDIVVIESSHREFETSAIAAVSQWKFKPARIEGRAVNLRAAQLLNFDPLLPAAPAIDDISLPGRVGPDAPPDDPGADPMVPTAAPDKPRTRREPDQTVPAGG